MDQTIYLIYIVSFVLGSIVGLLFSYKKYKLPFVSEKFDLVAILLSIIGWFLFLNNPLLTFIPSYISITIGIFLVAFVVGMRPGYGRYETLTGFVIALIIWIIRTVLL